MTDTNVVVSPTNVELGEVVGIMQLVNEVRDERERSCILDSDIIKTMIVLYRAEFAILLVYKEEEAGHGQLGRVDIALTKVVSNIIFQGSGFIRSEAIDRTFPKCGTRDKINGMIPRLVLWEAMGGLFAEHFSIYAVLGRNLNKRSSRGKTSRKLGRGSGFGRYLEEVFFD